MNELLENSSPSSQELIDVTRDIYTAIETILYNDGTQRSRRLDSNGSALIISSYTENKENIFNQVDFRVERYFFHGVGKRLCDQCHYGLYPDRVIAIHRFERSQGFAVTYGENTYTPTIKELLGLLRDIENSIPNPRL